nr:unknown [Ipomoea trifida]
MTLNPCPVYSFVAPGLLMSQCSAMARHPQLLALASALAMSFFAIPFLRKLSRTATFDIKEPSSELPVTATRQVLSQPLGMENPNSIPISLSILNTKSRGKEYSGKKELQ